jgi:nucleoside-diphosphate-sugar epimerase
MPRQPTAEPPAAPQPRDRRRRGDRAVVTGGAGFVGSHLVDRLLAEGLEVLVVDDLSTGRPENLDPAARLEIRDIAGASLDGLFRRWRPAVVFHLAAQASVPRSIQEPRRDLAVNVIGTHAVAGAARAAGAQRLVFVSSGGAVYGETRRPVTERARPAPASYYGIHKLAAEGHVALAGLSHAIARPSNIYGPRQAAGLEGAVVAAFVGQALDGGSFTIHGDGRQTRDLVHVTDVVEGLWVLGTGIDASGIWNVASGRNVSVLDLADTVERAAGRRIGRSFGPRRPGDVRHSAISAARLRRHGWEPAIYLEAGIRELVAGTPVGARGSRAGS